MTTLTSPVPGTSSAAAGLPDDVLLKWLHDMLAIREFEVRCMQAYQDKKIGGFCHVYIGQEAVAVGAIAAVRPDDPVITAYRDHGHALARGMDARHAMAEMFGRIGGCAKGKGGSMHMFDRPHWMFGGHGIVGAQCPLGAGLAFATKYMDEMIDNAKSKRVTLCFLGDGALNQGAFHEAMNLAGVLHLPVIFCCENNGYSMGTSVGRGTTMGHEITAKAAGYGMESAVLDGMDVMSVYDGLRPVVDRCREKCRPAFIDIRTYRFKGHSMSDPRKYRTREEEAQYEQEDPIRRLATWLMTNRGVTPQEVDAMNQDVRREIREAVQWADASPAPDSDELYRDVYADSWGPYTGTEPPLMMRNGRSTSANNPGASAADRCPPSGSAARA
jgi:pyruvate dehydrogenase E1 component alpha subunit